MSRQHRDRPVLAPNGHPWFAALYDPINRLGERKVMRPLRQRTAQVALAALASPDGQKDMTWNVDGLVNPTIVVPRGAQVTVHFFDADTGTTHGWELTSTPPSYPSMVMMDAQVAFPGAFAMPVRGATAQQWFGRTVQFTAATAGTFYYLCPVPGHARQGMYGTLIVQ